MLEPSLSTFEKVRNRALKSRFLTVSVLLHVLLVVILGGTVLFKAYVEPPDFTGGGSFVEQGSSVAPPQQPQQQQPTFQVQTPTAATNAPSLSAITTVGPSSATFSLPSISTPTISTATSISQPTTATVSAPQFGEGLTAEAAKGIAEFTGGWAAGGSGGPGSSVKARKFKFTAYLAKYAGGDWGSTVRLANGKIAYGSLPNLLYTMNKWSSDKIEANPLPEPLDLGDEKKMFSVKPAFILFTGHKDFVLTETEVANLQKYIRLGGCVWGDSSLPGRNSRFDIAFRREMRRVIPDKNKDFEVIGSDHPVYSKAAYYPEITSAPEGVNYYKEQVEALKIYGEIGVIYTMNDYGDMWQIGLNEKGEIDTSRDKNYNYVAINKTIWDARSTYIRNIDNAKTLEASYKFGTNMVIHLITRWEDKLRFVPTGL